MDVVVGNKLGKSDCTDDGVVVVVGDTIDISQMEHVDRLLITKSATESTDQAAFVNPLPAIHDDLAAGSWASLRGCRLRHESRERKQNMSIVQPFNNVYTRRGAQMVRRHFLRKFTDRLCIFKHT